MRIEDIIIDMAVEQSKEPSSSVYNVTLSFDNLVNFSRKFALDVLHDTELQNELLKEVN